MPGPCTNDISQYLSYSEELLDSINDALIASDKYFIITNWNKAAERIYGIRAKDAIGRTRAELLQYEYMDSSSQELLKELKNFNKWKGILKFTKKDGTAIYLQSSASVVKDQWGEIAGYVAVNRDITHQYAAEQSLQNFTAVLSFLEESFLIVDRSRKVVFLSPKKNVQAFHQSDYKVGDPAMKYIPENQQEEVSENYNKAFSGETITHEAASDGEEAFRIYLNITYMPVKNNYGNVTHVAIIIKDLTEEKRAAFFEQKKKEAEENLYQSRRLFEDFMENCPLPAWITDEDGIMRYMNPNYIKEIFFTKEALGKNIKDLFPKTIADDYYTNNASVLKNNKAISVVEQAAKADGSSTTYLVSKFPLQYEQKRMVAGWAVDITEQVKAQQLLEESNQYKDKLLSVIAHDLRSPLTLISSLAQLVAGDAEAWSKEELLDFFNTVKTSNDKALNLLKELQLWGQSRQNRINRQPQQIDVSAVIYTSIEFLQEKLEEKNITVHYNLHPQAVAYADMDMVKTVIRNVVSNAIKFSPVQSAITINTSIAGNDISISIADEGAGIKEEIKNRILQGTNATSCYGTIGEKGTGLGLSICKDFIEANKGIMTISNNETKGMVFAFSLPEFIPGFNLSSLNTYHLY